MSSAVDAQVLLQASDEGSPHHGRARRLVERLADGPGLFYLPWPVLTSYLELVTSHHLHAAPLDPADALANVDALLTLPHVRPLGAGPRFAECLRLALGPAPVGGRAVADAQLAAVLLEHGVRVLHTTDPGFRRHDFLDVRVLG